MQYAAVDPALLATYAAADRYQLMTSQPLTAAGMQLSAARYAVPTVAPGVTYAPAGYVKLYTQFCKIHVQWENGLTKHQTEHLYQSISLVSWYFVAILLRTWNLIFDIPSKCTVCCSCQTTIHWVVCPYIIIWSNKWLLKQYGLKL